MCVDRADVKMHHRVHRKAPEVLRAEVERVSNIDELEDAVKYCLSKEGSTNDQDRRDLKFKGLRNAIKEFTEECASLGWGEDIVFGEVMPAVLDWAKEGCLETIPILTHRSNEPLQKYETSSRELRSFIANVFLCNVADVEVRDEADWRAREGIPDGVNLHMTASEEAYECRSLNLAPLHLYSWSGVPRVKCFLYYFLEEWIESRDDAHRDERTIVFERHRAAEVPEWHSSNVTFRADDVHVHTMGMESAVAGAFVDFANRYIHIHKIIASATQEEVLFSCAPECFLAILLYDALWDNDVAVFRNIKRYCSYTGYLASFRCTGRYKHSGNVAVCSGVHESEAASTTPSAECESSPGGERSPPVVQDIIVIDAVYTGHTTEKAIVRDLGKCFRGWKAYGEQEHIADPHVSTGKWGSGAFGGDECMKFVQQVCAAAVSGTPIYFSTFRDSRQQAEFAEILQLLENSKVTVGEVVRMMIQFREHRSILSGSATFQSYFVSMLRARLAGGE